MVNQIIGRIFNIKRYAIHDGPGIRTTVFLQGCPLDCWWCHNPEGKAESSNYENKPGDTIKSNRYRKIDVEQLMAELIKDTIFYEQSGGGITFSGGEPMNQIDFLEKALRACRDIGFHTTLDTCGYAPREDYLRIMPLVNLFLYDIKFINDEQHEEFTGVSNALILSNLKFLADSGADITVCIPMIPDITDTSENLSEIAEYLKGMAGIERVRLLPYNKLVESKIETMKISDKLGRKLIQTRDDLELRSEIFNTAGFEVKIGG